MAWPVGFIRSLVFFTAPEGEGWSEEYLFMSDDFAAISTAMGQIITDRLNMLAPTFSIEYCRISDPHSPHTVQPYNASPVLPAVGTYAAGDDFQRSEVGALVKFFTTSGRFAMRIFRGVADNAINTDGSLNTGTAWYDAFSTFLSDLLNPPVPGLINVKATATFPAYTFQEYDNFVVRRSTTRDTGRPFGLRRGRSAAA